MLSSYVVDDGGRRGGLGLAMCLDQEGLKMSNNVGVYEFVENMVTACLEVVYSSF